MSQQGDRRRLLRGVWLLATFRKDGFQHFAATRDAYFKSLTPVAALLLVAAIGAGARFGLDFAVRMVLVFVVGILAPQVVSHFIASRIRREHLWLGYSVAFNWSQWAIPVFALSVLAATGILAALGLPDEAASGLARVGITGYALALYVFITRNGLALSLLGSIVFIIAVNLAASMFLVLPGAPDSTLN